MGIECEIHSQCEAGLTWVDWVPDPRTRACRYPWEELMFAALCGVCSGADDWVGVVDWATLKLD